MARHHTDIQLVCFDVGGVLVRICRSWDEGCRAAGISIRHDDHQLAAWRDRWHQLVELHQTGRLALDDYAVQVSAMTDGLYAADDIRLVHHAWLLEQYTGVADVVADLHDADIDTAALSNTNHAHAVRFGDYPALRALRTIYASHELGLHKPDPAIYRAVQTAHDIDAGAILFFDDLPENVDAARAAGWHAQLIDPLRCTATQIRDTLRCHGVLPLS